MDRRSSDLVGAICAVLAAVATQGACGRPDSPGTETTSPGQSPVTLAAAAGCPSTYVDMCPSVSAPCCADTLDFGCNWGSWPNGVIPYRWGTAAEIDKDMKDNGAIVASMADQTSLKQAMRDWEAATNNVIAFRETTGIVPYVRMFSSAAGTGGRSTWYAKCKADPANCKMSTEPQAAYHEIGHLIFNIHHFKRNDRNHYHVSRGTAGECANGDWTRCADDVRDFGPYDFKSALYYKGSYPAFARFDGTPINQNTCGPAGSPGGTGTAPPPCPAGSNCATCMVCEHDQPAGRPTALDGSAVVEQYRNLLEPSWKKFRRTVQEVTSGPGATLPFDYSLAPGVKLSTVDPTPALASRGGNDFSIYVLGSDKHIYTKWRTTDTPSFVWSSWHDLGCCFNSAPGAVSWGAGREDVVARGEDNAIYIKTFSNGASTAWDFLGGAAGSAPSITSWGANRLDIFVRALSGQDLLVRSCTANCNGGSGTWTAGWEAKFPNGGLVGRPAVVSRGSGLIDIYVHGGDHRLYANQYYNGVGGSWSLVANGPLQWDPTRPSLFSPAVAARSANYIEVFARGVGIPDNKLSVITWRSGAWDTFKVLGGVLASAPGTVSRVRDTPRSDVAVAMAEETTFNGPLAYGVWWKAYDP